RSGRARWPGIQGPPRDGRRDAREVPWFGRRGLDSGRNPVPTTTSRGISNPLLQPRPEHHPGRGPHGVKARGEIRVEDDGGRDNGRPGLASEAAVFPLLGGQPDRRPIELEHLLANARGPVRNRGDYQGRNAAARVLAPVYGWRPAIAIKRFAGSSESMCTGGAKMPTASHDFALASI